jgi:hypothetical protein
MTALASARHRQYCRHVEQAAMATADGHRGRVPLVDGHVTEPSVDDGRSGTMSGLKTLVPWIGRHLVVSSIALWLAVFGMASWSPITFFIAIPFAGVALLLSSLAFIVHVRK